MITTSIALQAAATVTTFFAMWKMGDRHISGPVWGLASQIPWTLFVWHDGVWGIFPITVAMTYIHARNFLKWRKA